MPEFYFDPPPDDQVNLTEDFNTSVVDGNSTLEDTSYLAGTPVKDTESTEQSPRQIKTPPRLATEGDELYERGIPGTMGFERSPSRSPPVTDWVDESTRPPPPSYEQVEEAGFGIPQLAIEIDVDSDAESVMDQNEEQEPDWREGDDEYEHEDEVSYFTIAGEGVDEGPPQEMLNSFYAEEEQPLNPFPNGRPVEDPVPEQPHTVPEQPAEGDEQPIRANEQPTEGDEQPPGEATGYEVRRRPVLVGRQGKRYVPFHRRGKLKRRPGRPRKWTVPVNKRSTEEMDKINQRLRDGNIDPDYIPHWMKKDVLTCRGFGKTLERLARESKPGKHIVRKITESEELAEMGCTTRAKQLAGINTRTRLDEAEMSQPLEHIPKKVKEVPRMELIKETVFKFYMDDINSRCSPGKQDYVRVEGERIQKRICNDYIKRLHLRYNVENPHLTCSLSTFYKFRPAQVLTSKYLSKDTTCCQKHQNFQLLIKALEKILPDVRCATSPDAFIEHYDTEEKINELLNTFDEEAHEGMVVYEQWGRQKQADNKTKTRIIRVEEEPADFLRHFYDRYIMFVQHNNAANNQYYEQRRCKDNLKPGECMVQMDFIQNYACLVADGVQSSFFDQTQVTIHATVVYYRTEEGGDLQHKSFVHISPLNKHNSAMVYTIITKLWTEDFKEMKEKLGIHTVHYYTDSPFSQYRNKWMFHLISKHEEFFGMKATWDYFECGHGKGPCDGVGGTIKRLADQAQKQGAKIQDAKDFMKWAIESKSLNFTCSYISPEDFQPFHEEYEFLKTSLGSLNGTKKLHAVRATKEEGIVEWRELSCKCTPDDGCDCEWMQGSLKKPPPAQIPGMANYDTDIDVGDNVMLEFKDNVYLCLVKEKLPNDRFVFKAYYRKEWYVSYQFQLLRSGKRIVTNSSYVLHKCKPLLEMKNNKDVKKLTKNDLKVFNDFVDILMV